MFEAYLGETPDTIARQIRDQVYLRASSFSIYSDLVHEGTHAEDYFKKRFGVIPARELEYRAYSAEREYQIKAGLPVDLPSEDDIWVHIWGHYGGGYYE